MKRPRLGSVNRVISLVALPEHGKTDLATRLVLDIGRELPAYRLAVDPNGNLPRELWDGTPTGVMRHEWSPSGTPLQTIREQLHSGNRQAIHSVRTDDAAPMILLASEVAARGLSAEDAHGERYGLPVIVLVDEMAMWEEAAEGRLGPTLRWYLTQRRWLHVILIFGTQSPLRVHYAAFEFSTEFYLGAVNSVEVHKKLRRDGSVPPHVLAQLWHLEPHEWVHWRRGEAKFTHIDAKGRRRVFAIPKPKPPTDSQLAMVIATDGRSKR